MPVRDPQNEFAEIPWIGLFLIYSLIGNPQFARIPGEGFWGPRIAFSGEDGVDMWGSGELCVFLSFKLSIKTFISCYRPPGPQKGFRKGF